MKNLLNIIMLLIYISISSNCNIAIANNNDSFLWDLTKDMTKAVASELVKSAIAENLKDNNYYKSENEIKRLKNIISTLRNNKEFKEAKIQELETNINKLQSILLELKLGSKIQLHKLKNEKLANGRWFVILGSYKPKDYQKAIAKKTMLERKNFIGVDIFNTDNYPNLKSGLYIVNIGPLSKEYALRLQNKLKAVIPDAYIK